MCVSMTCAAAAVCLSGVRMVRKMVKCAEREKVGNSDEEQDKEMRKIIIVSVSGLQVL